MIFRGTAESTMLGSWMDTEEMIVGSRSDATMASAQSHRLGARRSRARRSAASAAAPSNKVTDMT
jgi:hypothetical protein